MNLTEIEKSAASLLDLQPEAAPRVRLLRDVLRVPANDFRLVSAKTELAQSEWVHQLADSQDADGIWGRFHSQDLRNKSLFPTSEYAIQRALALGLDKKDAILQKVIHYLERFLNGSVSWTDRQERSEGWFSMTHAISASALARIDPAHPLLEKERLHWAEIAVRAFPQGRYDPQAEAQAHRELNGLKTPSYFDLHYSHPLIILSSGKPLLPEKVLCGILTWVYQHEDGIYYVSNGTLSSFPIPTNRRFLNWLNGLELLAAFETCRSILIPAVEYISSIMDKEGFFIYEGLPRFAPYFPLSSTWRIPLKKKIDLTVRVLALLRVFT